MTWQLGISVLLSPTYRYVHYRMTFTSLLVLHTDFPPTSLIETPSTCVSMFGSCPIRQFNCFVILDVVERRTPHEEVSPHRVICPRVLKTCGITACSASTLSIYIPCCVRPLSSISPWHLLYFDSQPLPIQRCDDHTLYTFLLWGWWYFWRHISALSE
ncbi:hypothetical protein BU24DRAFT_46522 [Aaosphaeria arxii CBS 175.79]|uniref:Uncharacterized protein n=1 Tax=Aaosphaeria arxii CBS 175.79 TaxID=1450172 RepID=A0A6A5XDH3_9PLEO|nr:uncharacterized protein BU24DRAFT_46522 [Aaosphaeria arxii CBS 175.79]KAF2010814.1 hypothetical protein BU24DRAFT_46522 [Aaosphaeria arxii CBS 175.79]